MRLARILIGTALALLCLPLGSRPSAAQGWQLAVAWYQDRLAPDWRRRTTTEAQAIFAYLGLTGLFWQLA